MSQRFWICLMMLVVTSSTFWGLSGARLLGQSRSGQTALFNLGIHDAVKEGDFAVIVKEIRDINTPDLRLVPIAKAKNIKVNADQSVWILYRIYDAELLVKGDKYLILTESSMLSGRRDPRFGRISVVADKDKATRAAKDVLKDDEDRLAKKKSTYIKSADLHEKESRTDGDIDLIDIDGWEKSKNARHRTSLYKSAHAQEFKRELRLATFEKLVAAYVKKVNDPKFNYAAFYDEQMKAEFANEFRKKSNFATEYENFLSNQAQRAIEDAKLYRAILEKGESWSEVFSDEELRRVLSEVSVLQETDRRKIIVSRPNRYALYLGYGFFLNDAQTESDLTYRRGSRYSIDVEGEMAPFLKHETLERFTLNASLRTNKTAFEANGMNADLDEVSFTAGLNWYPLYAPYVVEAPVFFLGGYLRSGWAEAIAPTVAQKANYQVFSFPGLRGGMKYNFRNNVGLRIVASMETLNIERYESSTLGSVLPENTSFVEGKMNFAVAYSF